MRLLKYLIASLNKGKYTSTKETAEIIRRFVNGCPKHPYEWDDFETQNEQNPEAEIALALCWFYAKRYPSSKPTEYCGAEAMPYFLKIADALEKNKFKELNYEEAKKSLANKNLPEQLKAVLEKN